MEETDKKILSEVIRRFPDMAGVEPSISSLPNANRLFTFKARQSAEDGSSISTIVKITVDKEGNLLKVTTSRG